jgi:hypothetical protein
MGSPAGRLGIMATAVLAWWMLLGELTFGQEDGPSSAASLSPPLQRSVGTVDYPNFDAGQETPAPPVTPAPAPEGDIFGVGFYDLGPSAQAKRQAPGLRDEWGVELFYNLRIAPGCHLTPDLQVLHPGLAPVANALVFGVRLKVDF